MRKFLHITTWNINSPANRYYELETRILLNRLVVILVSDTHFTDRIFFKLHGFSLYTTDPPNHRANKSAITLIKNKLDTSHSPHTARNTLKSDNN